MQTTLDYSRKQLYDVEPEGELDTPPLTARNIRMFLRHEAQETNADSQTNIHDQAVLFICLSGCGRLLCNSNVFELTEGAAILVMPRMLHARLPLPGKRVQYLLVRFSPGDSGLFDLLSDRLLQFSKQSVSLLNEFITSYQDAETGHSRTKINETIHLFELLLSSLCDSGEKQLPSTTLPSRIEKACRLLLDNSEKLRTFEDIAAELNVTPNHLRTCFRQSLGYTPKHLKILQLKMNAENLLLNTDLPITEIADRLNFNSIYTFSRFFRRYLGMSPSEFRKTH